jgi:hypothetical protein
MSRFAGTLESGASRRSQTSHSFVEKKPGPLRQNANDPGLYPAYGLLLRADCLLLAAYGLELTAYCLRLTA